nr:MAG TPA: hypothetical protein [Crassvirales sp.]
MLGDLLKTQNPNLIITPKYIKLTYIFNVIMYI